MAAIPTARARGSILDNQAVRMIALYFVFQEFPVGGEATLRCAF
jgi:hypothetical protein